MLWYLFVLCYCFVLYLLVNGYPFAVIKLYYSSDINNSILPKSRSFIYCNRIVLHHTVRCFSSQRQAAYFAMDVFLWCIACGIVFLFIRDTDSSYHIRIIKGILCAGAAYYLFGILYAIYHTYIKKDNKYDDEKK